MNRPIEQDAYRYVSLDQLRQLHQGGTDLAAARAAESSDRSVLHFAAFDGKLDRVRFLVEKAGVPITVTMRNRDMPIIEAVSRGHQHVVAYLFFRHQQAGNGPTRDQLVNRAVRDFELRAREVDRNRAEGRVDEFNLRNLLRAENMHQFLTVVLPVLHKNLWGSKTASVANW